MHTPTPVDSPKWRPSFPPSPSEPGSPPRAHLDLPFLNSEFELDPPFVVSEAASQRQTPAKMTRPHTPAQKTRPHTPAQMQLSTPPPTVTRPKATPQSQKDGVVHLLSGQNQDQSDTPDHGPVRVAASRHQTPQKTRPHTPVQAQPNTPPSTVARPKSAAAQPQPQHPMSRKQSGIADPPSDKAVLHMLGMTFLAMASQHGNSNAPGDTRSAVTPARLMGDIPTQVPPNGSVASSLSATISEPGSGPDMNGERVRGDESGDDAASNAHSDWNDAHSQFASYLNSPIDADDSMSLHERVYDDESSQGCYDDLNPFSPAVMATAPPSWVTHSLEGTPDAPSVVTSRTEVRRGWSPSSQSDWSGSSYSNYTPSDDDFEHHRLEFGPDDPFYDLGFAAGDEPIELPLPRQPTPEVVDLVDIPDSDEEEEDWGSLDGIDDGPGKAAARRLGRKTCGRLLKHRYEASIYRLLRGGDVDDDRKKRKKKNGDVPTRRVGDTGEYVDVAKYFNLDHNVLDDIKIFDDWARQYLRRGHGAALILQSAFLSRRSPPPPSRQEKRPRCDPAYLEEDMGIYDRDDRSHLGSKRARHGHQLPPRSQASHPPRSRPPISRPRVRPLSEHALSRQYESDIRQRAARLHEQDRQRQRESKARMRESQPHLRGSQQLRPDRPVRDGRGPVALGRSRGTDRRATPNNAVSHRSGPVNGRHNGRESRAGSHYRAPHASGSGTSYTYNRGHQ